MTIFILFIQGFELLVFRYTNISCKIRSTSSNKMACVQMYSWMKYRLQTASNGAKENQHHRGWMVFGRCMDRTLFFVGFLFPQLNSQWLRGSNRTLDGLKTGKRRVVHCCVLRHTSPWVWTSVGRVSSSCDIRWIRYPSFFSFFFSNPR